MTNIEVINRGEIGTDKLSQGTSDFTGVSREGSKWRAELSVDGKTFDFGLHDYEHEAAQIYASEELKYHTSKQSAKYMGNDMTDLNPAEFELINLDAIWTDEIYPLIRKDATFADLCTLAIAPEHGPVRQDIWERGPWVFSHRTWSPILDSRFDKAVAEGHTEAVRIAKESEECTDTEADNYAGQHSLWQSGHELFGPKKDEADWFRTFGNSQRLVYPMRRAAELWKPNGEWKVLEGDWHSTLISWKYRQLFDILAMDPHLIMYATQKAEDPTSGPDQREIDTDIPF